MAKQEAAGPEHPMYWSDEERAFVDKAAIAAMQGILSSAPEGCRVEAVDQGSWDAWSAASYRCAQAMLAERKRLLQEP